MKILIVAAVLSFSIPAYSESFFQAEVGVGAQHSQDMGDGTWIQQGLPSNRERTSGPAYMVGVTGTVFERSHWSLGYHLDYVYFGGLSASVDGVGDNFYDPHAHKVTGDAPPNARAQFNGQGHTQGIQFLLAPGYSINGYKLSVEGGPWLYWATWHDTAVNDGTHESTNLSHKTHMQVGWVAGASVNRGPWSISYRHYFQRQMWNTTPGIVTGTDMISISYKF